MLEQDAAKCAKLTDLFRGKAKVDGDAPVSETNGSAGTGHSSIAMTAVEDGRLGDLPVSELLERANSNLVRSAGGPVLTEGDIVVDEEAERNADPCTSSGCMWRPWTDGMVYIPYYINNQYSSREKAIITRGLESFSSFSCIRFRPSRSSDRDWISIESKGGCFSSIGRRGGGQVVSLARQGCLYHGTVQHELLHALGFNHEQTRSDRDQYIRVVLQNVQSGMEHNFRKKNTLNQGTSYDYNSVMQYHRYAFSKNNQPTMVPIPDANVSFGKATQMSRNDIARLNTLYKCCECRPHQRTGWTNGRGLKGLLTEHQEGLLSGLQDGPLTSPQEGPPTAPRSSH
ncbi:unnamed protein product [Gadus morhua 'NCC']